jgi:hypothetical protein
MKELDGAQRSASVCGRFTPEEISAASQRREAEKDEHTELTVLKNRKAFLLESNQGFHDFQAVE